MAILKELWIAQLPHLSLFPKSTISLTTDAAQYLNTAHCVTGNGTDQIALNKPVNSRFPVSKDPASQKPLIYFSALEDLHSICMLLHLPVPPPPNSLPHAEMSQYNIAACGYDKHFWIIFFLWCYEVSWMYLISTTKAVIEFVEGRKQSIIFVWLNGGWNQQQWSANAQSTRTTIISDTIFQAKTMIGGWTNRSRQSHAAALMNATRVWCFVTQASTVGWTVWLSTFNS